MEIEAKYRDYIARQSREVERISKLEQRPIPSGVDYDGVRGLSNEARENLSKFLAVDGGTGVSGAGGWDFGLEPVCWCIWNEARDKARAI